MIKILEFFNFVLSELQPKFSSKNHNVRQQVEMKIKPITTKGPDGIVLSLTIGREYEVLGIEADWFRLLNDPDKKPYGNDPVLFEPECFEIVDPTIPSFWVCTTGDDGEQYCYPPEWNEVGFFEDYHEGVETVRIQFWEDLRRYYPETWKARTIVKV